MHPPTNRTSRSWLPGFLAGLTLGVAVWQWRQRKDRAEISRLRLEREAESERLRLRLTSIQDPEPVIDLTEPAPAPTPASGGAAAPAVASVPSPSTAPSPARAEAAPVLSVVVDTPAPVANGNGRHDDLKRIKGIGPVMERSLNEQGIHSFQQLANLTKPEIEQLTAAIAAFPGRIEREDWVGSARRLLDAEQSPDSSPLF